MPIHTSAHAHAHAHAHARPAYACPPRTSAPKPLLAHPRCAIHVTCDIACSTMPSPTHGALRNCTAFHNPSARLQPRRMGAELMHTKWENYPLPSHAWMCLCVFLSFASHPLLACVPTSLTCIHREPQHTPSTASIFAPPHRQSPLRCQSTVAKSSCAPATSASQCRNRSYVVRIIIGTAKDLTFSLPACPLSTSVSSYQTRPARSCLAGKACQIVLEPMPGIRLARAHCSLSFPHRPQLLLKMVLFVALV